MATDSQPYNFEQAEYDRRWQKGQRYGGEFAGYTPHFLKFMTSHAPHGSGRRALDLGCGAGFFSARLAEKGFDVTGIDLSPVGVERAAETTPDAKFLAHDLTQPLPFPDGSFDLVWCSEVLEHLFAPLEVVREIRRVLRLGGTLLVTVPYHGLVKNLGIALLAFDRHYDPEYPHIRFFTKKTLSDIVRKAGLTLDTVTQCGAGLGMRDWIVPTNILLAAHR